jgi:predicted porin
MSTSYDFSGDLSGLSLGAAYSSSDRTNDQVGQPQKASVLRVAKKLKPGPLARNTMQTAFTWR